jgi:hypothetical protein
MRTATGTQEQIESYLIRLRAGLRGFNEQDAQDIVEELRSHITDKMAMSEEVTPAGVDVVLGGLGSPEELAQQYLTDEVLACTEASRSPLQIIKNTFRWASLSVGGLFVLLGSLMGYAVGLLLLLWAVLKPLHPHTAGLWASRDSTGDLAISVHVWAGSAAPGSRDVLGWWIVPLGVLAGCGLVMLTTRLAAWYAKQSRKPMLRARG